MKVTIRQSTGRLIEAQSGNANLSVMIANALAQGIPSGDIIAREATEAEFLALLAASQPPPIDQSDLDQITKQMKALALCVAQIGGLTVPQMKALFKSKYDSLP